MNTCPDCKCQFVQPFKCITCGAEKLYDTTVKRQATRIARLHALLATIRAYTLEGPLRPDQAEHLVQAIDMECSTHSGGAGE